ncbi:PilT/PilU family type 4a pilus ATPase [Halopseudomonas sabulinigri]
MNIRSEHDMDIHRYLKALVEKEGSDLFFSVGAPVTLKREGEFFAFGNQPLANGAVKDLAWQLMSEKQIAEFEVEQEMNLAVGLPQVGRFRVNVYYQRGEVGMVIRHISHKIPAFAELGLPKQLEKLALKDRGLVLVVGATGSGKSTTLAAMLDYRNTHRAGHIVCIEDPIEFLHKHKKAIIDQREVGLDTQSFAHALRNVLRESPDVIMIGEIRDRQTMQHALHYSETGHLVVATLHATNSVQAVDRIVNLFPDGERKQTLGDISANLAGIIAQRLVPGTEKKRVAAVEVLLRTPYIRNLIARDELSEIKDSMNRGQEPGLQSFDQHLHELVSAGTVSMEMALRYADSPTDLKLKAKFNDTRSESPLKMEQSGSGAPAAEAELEFKAPSTGFSDSDLTDDFR